ncbi:MAG: hypothetical protein IJO32_01000 [Bacilli bacterium]|nr:hypothetical protein [Bacilli bacterium]
MDKNTKLVLLYDYYSSLLTEKQQEYFEDYYFNNLSLSEISENNDVSRNAVHKQIKEVEEKLYYYEEKLNLFDKNKKISEILKNCSDENLIKQIEDLI